MVMEFVLVIALFLASPRNLDVKEYVPTGLILILNLAIPFASVLAL